MIGVTAAKKSHYLGRNQVFRLFLIFLCYNSLVKSQRQVMLQKFSYTKIEFKSGISITWSLLLYVLTVQCSVEVAAVLDCSFNGLKSFLTDNSDLQVGRAQAVKCKLPSLESRKWPKHSPKHEFLNCKLSQFNWMYHTHLKHKQSCRSNPSTKSGPGRNDSKHSTPR